MGSPQEGCTWAAVTHLGSFFPHGGASSSLASCNPHSCPDPTLCPSHFSSFPVTRGCELWLVLRQVSHPCSLLSLPAMATDVEGNRPTAHSGRLPGGRRQGGVTCSQKNAKPLCAQMLRPCICLLVPGPVLVTVFVSLVIGSRSLVNTKNHEGERMHTLLVSEGRWLEPVLRVRTSF